ncbi:MAG: response regulator [Clostridiales Family XIII bacterium]|nr:response regulator [Clostridiales Family XIII bacterium]
MANLVCILGVIGAVAATIIKLLEGMPTFAVFLISGTLIVGVLLYLLFTRLGHNSWGVVALIVSATDVLIPITFIWGGGIKSALPVYFSLGIVLHFLVVRGPKLIIMLCINVMIFLGCIAFSYFYPQHIFMMTPEYIFYLDNIQGVLINGFFIGLLFNFQLWVYDVERRKATAATKVKSEFLANMSHEMRTPMNAIIGMTMIAESTDDPERIRDALKKIHAASNHLLGVVNDVLDMSKIEADKLELSPITFSYKAMIEQVSSVIEPNTDAKNQKFIIDIDENLPDVYYGDDIRLAQVLTNLLNNAMKFTPDGGKIECKVKLTHDDKGMCTILTEVSDSGIGISEEQRSRLFTSFEQAESNTTRKFGGTGLGLAISRRIIEMMGGKIWVTSQVGVGSVFSYTVTLQRGDERAFEDELKQSLSALESDINALRDDFSSDTILLAEDIEINQEIVMAMLESTGVNIDIAQNGVEALAMFSANPIKYNLIFMDIQMPEMDGFEATRQIRALDFAEAKTIPIIAMSANVFREDIERGAEAGMNGHIGKPIDFEVVLGTMRTYLN